MLDTCCCCIKLRTGGIIIGILGAIGAVLLIIQGGVEFKDVPTQKRTEQGIAIFIIALSLIASICLLIGAMKAKNSLILIWLIVDAIFVIDFIVHAWNKAESRNKIEWDIAQAVIAIGLSIYFWICIFSLYRENKR